MRKLKDEKKLLWCLKQFHQRKESQKWLAAHLGISTQRFRKIYAEYKHSLQVPKPKMSDQKNKPPSMEQFSG
jgi:hypothetical protein